MKLSKKQRSLIIVVCIAIFLLVVPIGFDKASYLGCEATIVKAPLYSVVRVEVMDLQRTKVYFFPNNLDANNNFDALEQHGKNLEFLLQEYGDDLRAALGKLVESTVD